MDRWDAILQLCKYHGIGSKLLPHEGKTIAEQAADEVEEANAAKNVMTPVPALPLNHENVVKLNATRLADSVLGRAKP